MFKAYRRTWFTILDPLETDILENLWIQKLAIKNWIIGFALETIKSTYFVCVNPDTYLYICRMRQPELRGLYA